MPEVFREYWKYFLGALLLHVLIAALFTVTIGSMTRRTAPQQLAIQAVVIDQSATRAARERERKADEQRRVQEEAAKQAQEAEAKRLADEQAAREQKAQEDKQAELKRQQEEVERQRQAEVQKQQQQAAEQQARAAAERKQHDDAEKKRVAEIQQRQRDEAMKRQAADEARQRAERETELKRQLAEEEGRNAAANSGLLSQYLVMIEQRIERNWNRPPSARPGLECEVKVAQAPGGTVLSVQMGRCNGDAAVMQSIEAAVYRSSPLPPPPDPRLFERNLTIIFKPAE
jgi:colicin import membrane protein